MKYKFDVKESTKKCVLWISKWFRENGYGCKAVIGISGGKDSSVAAALCVAALGKENVYGVLMPDGEQSDIEDAELLCNHLGIEYRRVNIHDAVNGVTDAMLNAGIMPSAQTLINLPARIRMSTLYAVAEAIGGRVCNTSNLSKNYVGYSTRYGDSVGDFSPLSDLTATEVKAIGRYLSLPNELIDKISSDSLSGGKTDEDNLGFTYDVLDKYIRGEEEPDLVTLVKIKDRHYKNFFKLEEMPKFHYDACQFNF